MLTTKSILQEEDPFHAQEQSRTTRRIVGHCERRSIVLHFRATNSAPTPAACWRAATSPGSREGRSGLHLQGGRHGILMGTESSGRPALRQRRQPLRQTFRRTILGSE